jgi:hypothetical protein
MFFCVMEGDRGSEEMEIGREMEMARGDGDGDGDVEIGRQR